LRYKSNAFTPTFQYYLRRLANKSLVLVSGWPNVILQKNAAILLLILASNIDNHFSQFIFKAQDTLNQNTRDTPEGNTGDNSKLNFLANRNIIKVENIIGNRTAIVKIILDE
jgi:hypothetical protein